jgi:2-methylcitrate dehydratase
MKEALKLAQFIYSARYEDLSDKVVEALKIRVIDSLGCAFGALNSPVIRKLYEHIEDFGGKSLSTLIGGSKTSPDRAAFYNSALIRYLDFNDSFLAKKETCHPSDNIGAILATAEYKKISGKDFLLAIAVAYQVQCRLSEEAPVRDKGFDHTTQGSYSVAAGVAKALKLTAEQTANALAIAGVAHNALRVTRTGTLSHWKGLAFPNTAFNGTHAAFLAYRNITGPLEIFEGYKGFKHSISGPFEIDWEKENLEKVLQTIIKKYNAEIHSQSTLEGTLELINEYKIFPQKIAHVEVETFDVAYHIIGGGKEGNKKDIHTKEEADHSLPYMVAAAILDGEVSPKQYEENRITKNDIQTLIQKITVRPNEEFSKRFPEEMTCRIKITMEDGRTLEKIKTDYEGFITRPMTWKNALKKFQSLAVDHASERQQMEIAEKVQQLESIAVEDLINVFGSKGSHL